MIFTQHYLACLSHASYLIGDETTGGRSSSIPRATSACTSTRRRDRGLTIERVIETHLHADFLSGHLELAAETGAVISYGEGADGRVPDRAAARRAAPVARRRRRWRSWRRPATRPSRSASSCTSTPTTPSPTACSPATRLFVGDVGRPDLLASAGADALGRRAGPPALPVAARQAAPAPDATRVFPAHGAGSSCGRQLSSETSSTHRRAAATNYALQPMGEDEFVAVVTEGQPARPQYFEFDAQRNREVRPLLDDDAAAAARPSTRCSPGRPTGAVLLDAREPADFAAGHLRGAVNVGLQGRFAEWAGDVLTPDRDIVLVGDPAIAVEAKVRLGRVGYDRVVGQLDDPAATFVTRPELVERSSRLTIEQLAELRGLEPDLQLVDVRGPGETASGTLPGAREIPLPALGRVARRRSIRAAPVVVYCASGYRSSVAASVLVDAGFATCPICSAATARGRPPGCRPRRRRHRRPSAATPQVSARAGEGAGRRRRAAARRPRARRVAGPARAGCAC